MHHKFFQQSSLTHRMPLRYPDMAKLCVNDGFKFLFNPFHTSHAVQ